MSPLSTFPEPLLKSVDCQQADFNFKQYLFFSFLECYLPVGVTRRTRGQSGGLCEHLRARSLLKGTSAALWRRPGPSPCYQNQHRGFSAGLSNHPPPRHIWILTSLMSLMRLARLSSTPPLRVYTVYIFSSIIWTRCSLGSQLEHKGIITQHDHLEHQTQVLNIEGS